jgi:hypothetical protein
MRSDIYASHLGGRSTVGTAAWEKLGCEEANLLLLDFVWINAPLVQQQLRVFGIKVIPVSARGFAKIAPSTCFQDFAGQG